MFRTGDAVIHPTLGAGIVVSVSNRLMHKKNQQFYKIKILGTTKTMLMIPVSYAVDIGLRPAISSVEIETVWHILSAPPEDLPEDNKKRKIALEEKLKTSRIYGIAELVRDIEWRKLQRKPLNQAGRKICDKAMSFLIGEIAVSQDMKMQLASAKIKEILNANLSNYLR